MNDLQNICKELDNGFFDIAKLKKHKNTGGQQRHLKQKVTEKFVRDILEMVIKKYKCFSIGIEKNNGIIVNDLNIQMDIPLYMTGVKNPVCFFEVKDYADTKMIKSFVNDYNLFQQMLNYNGFNHSGGFLIAFQEAANLDVKRFICQEHGIDVNRMYSIFPNKRKSKNTTYVLNLYTEEQTITYAQKLFDYLDQQIALIIAN